MKKKYYVVWQGRKPGVYDNWDICKEQIFGFDNAKYKSYPTLQEAEEAFKSTNRGSIKFKQTGTNRISSRPTVESISVDAACSGNPGVMEYQGVFTQSKQLIFHKKFTLGTNNIGEFLALVHALALVKQNGWDYHIYTDSMTALAWVRDKKCKTKMDLTNNPLQDLVTRAEIWLKNNPLPTQIEKWDTAAWGEIPADFGRK
ncbi:MAG: ribonuclease H family protein [Breznakibacter sp.]|nr:ribonuclease H family protein [Breznakibacter sp.]